MGTKMPVGDAVPTTLISSPPPPQTPPLTALRPHSPFI